MFCQHCKKPLHETRHSGDKKHLSCASCSKKHGKEHVYYDTSMFHSYQHQLTEDAHCIRCKAGRRGLHEGRKLCSQVHKE